MDKIEIDNITLEIFTPDGILFNGKVASVSLPGTKGIFTVLTNHAPIISSLSKGAIKYTIDNNASKIEANGGFVEVKNNIVTVCLETIIK